MTTLSAGAVRLIDAYDQALGKYVSNLNRLRGDARDTYDLARNHLAAARSAVVGAHDEAVRIMNDPMVPAQSRGRLIADLMAKAQTEVREATANAETAATVLRAQLADQALPKPPADRRDRADAERRLTALLDRTPADQLPAMLRKLSDRGDEVAGALHSQYGQDLAEVKGATPAVLNELRVRQVEAARTSTDPDLRTAALAEGEVGKLTGLASGLHMALGHLATDTAQAARESAVSADVAANRSAFAAGLAAGQASAA